MTYSQMKKGEKPWTFSYASTGCFGTCASFKMIIDQDGTLQFEGRKNCQFTGDTSLRVGPLRDSLILKLEQLNFHSLDYKYGVEPALDLPLHTYILMMDRKPPKEVNDMMDAPEPLVALRKWLALELQSKGLL